MPTRREQTEHKMRRQARTQEQEQENTTQNKNKATRGKNKTSDMLPCDVLHKYCFA
jgi:hypothetical protein